MLYDNLEDILHKLSIETIRKISYGSTDYFVVYDEIKEHGYCNSVIDSVQMMSAVLLNSKDIDFVIEFKFSPEFIYANYKYFYFDLTQITWKFMLPPYTLHEVDIGTRKLLIKGISVVEWLSLGKCQISLPKDDLNEIEGLMNLIMHS